eukprot:30321-Chlamydomonas_euryale.AAC.1
MNAGTVRGHAFGFKLSTLLKLPDIKAADKKTSLLRCGQGGKGGDCMGVCGPDRVHVWSMCNGQRA